MRQLGVATGSGAVPDAFGDVLDRDDAARSVVDPAGLGRGRRAQKPVPPGPGNPLGTRWMGISAPGVGLHGTPDAASIGYSASHGCIRMRIPDAEWLFNNVYGRNARLHHLGRRNESIAMRVQAARGRRRLPFRRR